MLVTQLSRHETRPILHVKLCQRVSSMELLHAIAALVALVLVGAALVAVWALRAVRAGRGTIVMAEDGSQTCVCPPSDGLLEHPSPYAMIVAAGLTVRVG